MMAALVVPQSFPSFETAWKARTCVLAVCSVNCYAAQLVSEMSDALEFDLHPRF